MQFPYTVSYGPHAAKFSDLRDAHSFAIAKSLEGFAADIQHKTGLVGQYRDGIPTEEFELHHKCAFELGTAEKKFGRPGNYEAKTAFRRR